MELSTDRHARVPRQADLPEVQGEQHIDMKTLLQVTASSVHFGGAATTLVGLVLQAAELAGRGLEPMERIRLTRMVRSNLATREVDRYLGAPRVSPEDLPENDGEKLLELERRSVGQLEFIRPDQVYKGSRLAFVGELIHGVTHAHAVRILMGQSGDLHFMPLIRLGEQIQAQTKLCEINVGQQFEELNEPESLSFLDVLGSGFDDPEKLHFACAARVLWESHQRPEEWEPLIKRTLAALE
jgi:hypothetical protein